MASTAAPGRLEIVREFINTLEIEESARPLDDSGTLAAWCGRTALYPQPDEQGLALLRAFREGLRSLLESHAETGEEQEGWQALEPFTARCCYKMRIGEPDGPALQAQGAGAELAIAQILAIVYDAIGSGTWPRLKACRKHSCRWAFYDRSKNGSGAWCSMRVCGNRVKAQRRRARQKIDEL